MTGGDDDRVRGFPAFPKLVRGSRRFARSWWGNAWLKALEDTSLDPEPLRRGRAYARTGHVGPITVSPGRIAAPVYGDDGTPYRTAVYVEQLTDPEWERFGHEVAAKAGHIAALLDRQMPHDLADAAADAGVRLLPGLGDLEPECDCPGWELPCPHAAALCYQAAWLLDEDPFVLLLMRGRGERELQSGWMSHPPRASGSMDHRSGRARPLLALPPAPGVDPDALELLAADAAVRAGDLLAVGESGEHADPLPALDLWQDTVRLAAAHPSLVDRLREASGRSPGNFARAVRAWECGGPAALDVLEADWSAPQADLARGRAAMSATWDGDDPPDVRAWRNHLTLTGQGLQLRYGRDGRWHPYREESGDWWPAGPPRRDPAAAVADLLGG